MLIERIAGDDDYSFLKWCMSGEINYWGAKLWSGERAH